MLNRLTVAQKILVIPVIGTIGFLIYLSISTFTAKQNVAHLSNAKEIQFPFVLAITDVAHKIEKLETSFNTAVTTGDEELVETAKSLAEQINTELTRMRQLSPDSASQISNISQLATDYHSKGDSLSLGMINNTIDFSRLGELGQDLSTTLEQLKAAVSQLKQARENELRSEIERASDAGENLVSIGLLVGSINIVLLFAIAVPISKSIQKSLYAIIESLMAMAKGEGDLTVRLHSRSQDEIGDLVNWFNAFIEKLQATIKEVVAVAEPLNTMAVKVNGSAAEAETVTDLQQTGIDQTRVAVSEMNASVKNIAENASLAADAVHQAHALSKQGSTVVGKTVESIGALASSVGEASDVVNRLENDVEQVGTVLSVIRGIADQTNLLALNAAIEAARAGEQGRGFAVVADEVRTLASRTQDSTTEIQTTIEKLQSAANEAVATMNAGRTLAQNSVEEAANAGDSLKAIETTVTDINGMATNIATATEEQSTVASNIVNSVNDISDSTHRTSRTAHELATVSAELNDLATGLNKLTSGFKV